MAYQINWTQRAWQTYEANIQYLLQHWTEKEVSAFVWLTDKRITLLSERPLIGSPRNKRSPNIRFTLIHKRILLIYKLKPRKKEIDLLVFWNTYQNPKKLKAR
jgi:plasmid stabilization system protein ParE